MESRFIQYIEQEKLFESHHKILLAVSGGIDSAIMVHLFKTCKFNFALAHCNFALRSNESDEDEEFVREIASKYNREIFVIRFETEKYADENKLSAQMAARELRYDWFEEIRKENNFDFIAIAHNQDDVVETFIINLVRGTGIKGITGIKSKTNKIIRPILFAQRHEILSYCKDNDIKYREDSSNLSTKYLRNKIRHEIIPRFKELNPKFNQTIIENISRFSDVEKIYEQSLSEIKSEIMDRRGQVVYLSIEKINSLPGLEPTCLFEILRDYGFSNKMINDIIIGLKGSSGKVFYSASHRLLKDRDYLIISPIKDNGNDNFYIDEAITVIDYPVKLEFKIFDNNDSFSIQKQSSLAYFDLEKIDFPLILRKWKSGDFFQPFGLDGLKKLSDYFIDNKFSIHDKENSWILASGENILWIIGHRADGRYKITDKTRKILQVELKEK